MTKTKNSSTTAAKDRGTRRAAVGTGVSGGPKKPRNNAGIKLPVHYIAKLLRQALGPNHRLSRSAAVWLAGLIEASAIVLLQSMQTEAGHKVTGQPKRCKPRQMGAVLSDKTNPLYGWFPIKVAGVVTPNLSNWAQTHQLGGATGGEDDKSQE
jgi:hypothetical protein